MGNNQVIGEFENWSMVVIYATDSGEIVHTHQSITTRGGKHPTKKQLERDARGAVKQVSRRTRPRRLSFLHIDPRSLDLDTHYKVDPNKRILVKTSKRKPSP